MQYVCPMHPQIVRPGPGDCPLCGMALEPEQGGKTAEDDAELRQMTRRLWVCTPLSALVVLLAMGEMLPAFRSWLDSLHGLSGWAQAALSTPVVLWGGAPFFRRGWRSVQNRSPNMWTLIALGTGAAYLFSVFGLLFPELVPDAFKGIDGGVPLYFEAASVIVTLVT